MGMASVSPQSILGVEWGLVTEIVATLRFSFIASCLKEGNESIFNL